MLELPFPFPLLIVGDLEPFDFGDLSDFSQPAFPLLLLLLFLPLPFHLLYMLVGFTESDGEAEGEGLNEGAQLGRSDGSSDGAEEVDGAGEIDGFNEEDGVSDGWVEVEGRRDGDGEEVSLKKGNVSMIPHISSSPLSLVISNKAEAIIIVSELEIIPSKIKDLD